MKIRVLALGAVLALVPLAAGCGSSGNDTENPPTAEAISRSLQDKADAPKAQADCVAAAVMTKLNPEQLNAIANDNKNGLSKAEEKKVNDEIGAAAEACITGGG
jgi:hypothetical protein